MNNKIRKKSWRLLQRIDGIGQSRKYCQQHSLVSSLITKKNYHSCIYTYLEWRKFNILPVHEQDNLNDLNSFLEEKAESSMQKTIDHYRCALSLVFKKKLRHVKSEITSNSTSRNYYLSEILIIIKNLSEKNAFSILLCYFVGLRAHELVTLRRIDEGQKATRRTWSSDRFIGIESYNLYLVKGKGGLVREVAVPNQLVTLIERRRLADPVTVQDRGVNYQAFYDLATGKALSQAFSRASKKELNWSTGLHGTRHSYAQNRLFKLTNMCIEYELAMKIVSEELGHFRPCITLCYLR